MRYKLLWLASVLIGFLVIGTSNRQLSVGAASADAVCKDEKFISQLKVDFAAINKAQHAINADEPVFSNTQFRETLWTNRQNYVVMTDVPADCETARLHVVALLGVFGDIQSLSVSFALDPKNDKTYVNMAELLFKYYDDLTARLKADGIDVQEIGNAAAAGLPLPTEAATP